MDYRKVDLEKISDAERIEFQNENKVIVIGMGFDDTFQDCTTMNTNMIHYIDPARNLPGDKLKRTLDPDDYALLKQQLAGQLILAFTKALPVVYPDYTKFTDLRQKEEFQKSVKVAIEKNAEIIKKYGITLPSLTKPNGRSL